VESLRAGLGILEMLNFMFLQEIQLQFFRLSGHSLISKPTTLPRQVNTNGKKLSSLIYKIYFSVNNWKIKKISN
jgi:hypothetical protein